MGKVKEIFKKYNIVLIILALTLIIAGTSYAFINFDMNGGKINNLTTPEIILSYDESGTSLNIDKKIETDEEGKALSYYTFEVSGSSSVEYPIEYAIYLTEDSSNTLTSDKIKFYLTKVSGSTEEEILSPTLGSELLQYGMDSRSLILHEANFNFTGTNSFSDEYRLRAWVDANNDFEIEPDITQNGTTQDIVVNSLTYKFKLNVSTTITLAKKIMFQGVVSSGNGLYVSNETNDGRATYYYKDAVENNYVSFAGFNWRVIRINEDGTVRLIMEEGIDGDKKYVFSPTESNYKYMYYSKSNVEGGAMKRLEDWYDNNLESYDSLIATSSYCEQAKVKYYSEWTSGNAEMQLYDSYTPDFRCEIDGNGYGEVSSKIGLISVDEALHAGGIFYTNNNYYYLAKNGNVIRTMSPAGYNINNDNASTFCINQYGSISSCNVFVSVHIHPVISLNANILATGSGTSENPWKIKN